ncbi:PGCB-like protein [Mya arenaria]|uniref:PGCB-like protein n=1 Tax=Mya arenaria TaxID=6604 RepID=A0ABY7F0W5_MYAAR|nr:PGCB-like protein [Mya arenaria]
MNLTIICLSLLPLIAYAMGTISTNGYKSYKGSSATAGNSLKLTTVSSVIGCLTLCAGYQHTSSTVCYAARYNGATADCEMMSRNSTGAVQWLADNQWKVFVRKCEAGWTTFKVSCYQLFSISKQWDDAKSACERVNASLVSITSKEEDDFINAYINGTSGTIWIGANERDMDGLWKWESGEEWESFGVNQPDGSGYVLGMSYNLGWISTDGRYLHFYLCEKSILK